MESKPQSLPKATLGEVARRAGVAPSSVSRVLSGHPDVSPGMRERVLSITAELGYEPDLVAQSLRRGTTSTVGFAVGDISNPLIAEIVKGAESFLRLAGFSMILTNSEADPDLDANYIRLFRQRRVDGLLLSLADESHAPTRQLLLNMSLPIVLVDRELPESPNLSAVLSDHYSGLLAATSHLLQRGHRSIALITGPATVRPPRERLRGFRDAFASVGAELNEELIRLGSFQKAFGYSQTHQLLNLPAPPTALIAGGNQLLIGVLQALSERNVRVGWDIALVTCDEVDITRFYQPPISLVYRDTVEVGRVAAELLLEQIRREAPPRQVLLPTRFIARASTQMPAPKAALS